MIEKRRAGGVEVEVEEEKEKWPLILGDRSWWNRSTSKLVVVQLLAAIAAVFNPHHLNLQHLLIQQRESQYTPQKIKRERFPPYSHFN